MHTIARPTQSSQRTRRYQVCDTLYGIALLLTFTLAGCVTARPCVGPRLADYGIPSCCMGAPYVWTGSVCAPVSSFLGNCGCTCSGPGCADRFDSKEACEAAYLHCAP